MSNTESRQAILQILLASVVSDQFAFTLVTRLFVLNFIKPLVLPNQLLHPDFVQVGRGHSIDREIDFLDNSPHRMTTDGAFGDTFGCDLLVALEFNRAFVVFICMFVNIYRHLIN